jgi:uncharacterized membrane protein YfcA
VSDLLLAVLLAIVALLYSAVGQAGGTGYIAAMGLVGLAPEIIKPTALALNILVAAIACLHFARAGLLTWRSCYPFGILGAPFSLAGGAVHLPPAIYQPVVGGMLLIAAYQMIRVIRGTSDRDRVAATEPPFLPSLATGGAIGFVSGVTGVGGGIFLAPLVLTMGWATTRQSAGISATFNLMNSAAALAGAWSTMPALPVAMPLWLLIVGIAGFGGSWLGARHLPARALRGILAFLLLAAGARMIAAPFL